MLVSCKEESRKNARRNRNVKVICQVELVLFTGPTKMIVPSMCLTGTDERLYMSNVAQKHNNRECGRVVVARLGG